jgi:CheY-like chemotaxis protein
MDVKKLKGISVLIVDDNKTNRQFLQEVLSRYGLEPEIADSGKEALRLLDEKSFQLLILDYQMPEMDGGTVLEEVRRGPQSDIPVILLSSGIRPEEIDRFIRLGISAHFFKPVNSRELIEAIMIAMGYEMDEEDVSPFVEVEGEGKDQKGIHVLVAEDNPINQRLIKQLLKKRGHRVDIVENGKLAVEKVKQQLEKPGNRYQMILMDIQMPEMDGIKATRKIRKIDKTIPIIALTAYAMKGDKRKFLSEGMNDYISKPIKKTFLFEVMDKYISRD